MMESFTKRLLLPIPEDEPQKALSATVFNYVCLSVIAFLAIAGFASIFIFVRKTSESVSTLITALLLLIAISVARRFSVETGSKLLVIGLWVIFTVHVWLSGGIDTILASPYLAIIAIAAVLLGPSFAIIIAGLSVAVAFGMTALHSLGYVLPPYYPMPPWSAWFVLLFTVFLIVPAINGTLRAFADASARARREMETRTKSEEALRDSEAKYRSLFNNAEVGMFRTRLDGSEVLDMNDKFLKIFGLTREEMQGKPSVMHWVDPQEREEMFRRLIAHGRVTDYECRMRNKQGEVRTCTTSLKLYREQEILEGSIIDITDRKKAEDRLKESEARVRMKLDAILSPEDDIGTLELADVIDAQTIQSLMDDFYGLTKIGLAIVDLKGNVLVATGWQDICTQFHRVHPETVRNCIESDTYLSRGIEVGTFKLYRCKNNMWDIATPIIVGGEHLGNLFLGQFFFENEVPDYDTFRSQARQYGFDEQQYLAALDRVPRWSRETIDTVMTFYGKLASMLSTLSYSNIKLARSLADQQTLLNSLRDREQRYRAVVDNIEVGISLLNSRLEIVEINKAMKRYFPHVKPACGQICYEQYNDPPGSEPCGYCPCVLTLRDGNVHEAITETPAGSEIRHYHLISSPIKDSDGQVQLIVELTEDITERKKAEQMLQQAERRYRRLFENAPLMYVITRNENGVPFISDCNQQFLSSVGYSREEVVEQPLAKFYSPASIAELLEGGGYAQAMAGKFLMGERQLLKRDGTLVPTMLYTTPETDGSGKTVGTCAMFVDITEQKKAEEAFLRSEAQLSNALTIAHLGHWEYDVAKDLFTFNDHFYKIFRTTVEQVGGYNMSSEDYARRFVHPDDIPVVADEIRKALDTTDPNFSGRVEHRIVYADGEIGYITVRYFAVKDDLGRTIATYGVNQDITERKVAEREKEELRTQLLQAQKMEAVGTLAGGIAHDFNNLLQVTLGYSELLLAEKSDRDPDYADLRKIHQAAGSGAELVRSLLTFSRKVEPKPVPINLNSEIRHVEKLLHRTIPRMIDIRLDLAENLERINADPAQIEQIIMNLAVNARDAMGEEGSLTIRTENVTLDERYCRLHFDAEPGPHILLTVSDTGHGMERHTLHHIFEPFYTTKELGRGTGLGLAMVHGIVHQHNGHITCHSEVGKGTTFEIYFPAIPSIEEPAIDTSGLMPAFGTETLMLVDDEEFVRELGERILTKSGYTVLTATNGEEALDLYVREKDRIGLVILDLIMPTMGGKDCLKELLRAYPEAKVLIASGYSADASAKECIDLGAKGFVAKPFRFKELLREVRKTLDESQ